MAVERTPDGWLAASRMSGKKYMFLEGSSDERFWKVFVNKDIILPQQVNGWENVVACVKKFNENAEDNNCIGIVDKDFEGIFKYKDIDEDNIFLTDVHDMEIMMYVSPAWESALAAINKYNSNIPSHEKILEEVFSITDRIGYLKLSSLKRNLNLQFKHHNKDREIELPKLEKLLDKNSDYCYLGDSKMIEYLYDYSVGQKGTTQIASKELIRQAFLEEISKEYPSYELSNGHDVSYLMYYILKKKYLPKHKNITIDLVETSLYAAYTIELLHKTNIYEELRVWTLAKRFNIFRRPSDCSL